MIIFISFPYVSIFFDCISITVQGLNGALFHKCVELLKSIYSSEGTTHQTKTNARQIQVLILASAWVFSVPFVVISLTVSIYNL